MLGLSFFLDSNLAYLIEIAFSDSSYKELVDEERHMIFNKGIFLLIKRSKAPFTVDDKNTQEFNGIPADLWQS